MDASEFVEQIQDVQQRVAELEQDASQLPSTQKSRLTESLQRLTAALRDLQVAEEAIRLLLSAVQQSRDSIIITTAELNPPGPEIVYVNPAFSEMTGYSSEDVLGKTPRLLQGPATDRQLLDDLRRHLVEGSPFHGEAINYHKDGTEFYVEWNVTPIRDPQGVITHYVAIQRNITERKRLEEERQQLLSQERTARHQAEIANRAKDEFLATLSHELRTPLTPILGWTKVLQTKDLPEAKRQDILEAIAQNARRQAQLVDDLLDISRIVQGKLTLNLDAVPLVNPITTALETVHLAAEAKSIQIETQLDAAMPPVMGDTGRLRQVIWNLLSNAIKFTPAGGQVRLQLQPVDRHAELRVSDTGQGIDPDLLPFIFERFRQGDSSITREVGGLGLGLSLCRQLVEAHGGTITAESAGEGQGATFTVRLPLSLDSSPSTAPATPTSQPVDLQGVRVLVVEDEPWTLQFIAFVLEQAGAVVTAVASAEAALQALSQTPVDILVSDIGLQGMDGYTLLHKLRGLPNQANRELRAIALTAYTKATHRQQTLAAGYDQHLEKPIEPEALITAIAIELNRWSPA